MAESEDEFEDVPILASRSPSIEAPSTSLVPQQSKNKRKRGAEKLRKKKRRKELGEDENDESHLVIDPAGTSGVNTAIAKLDPQLIADYVVQRVKRFEKELSTIELEDRYIPASAFMDTTSWQKARNLNSLPEYMETFSKVKGRGASLKKAREHNARPHTFVISGAALRAADLNRTLKKFHSKESGVVKMFAKHIKLKESIEFCKKTKIGIGVGTPGRILDLIKEDAIVVDDLVRIVIDASHINQKKRTIFEIKETQKQIMDLLCHGKLKKRLLDGDTIILFY